MYRVSPGVDASQRDATALGKTSGNTDAWCDRESGGRDRAGEAVGLSGASLCEEELVSIADIGEHDVYDIEVFGTHTFVANGIGVSNCQDLDSRHLPVLRETLSHATVTDRHGHRIHAKQLMYTGTPKSMEGLLEQKWLESSMAEWAIPCAKCHKTNYPTKSLDLYRMIGPMHKDIGEVHHGKKPGTICANPQCGLPINPRDGFWHHRYPDKILKRPGYHIPQLIIPLHYSQKEGWSSLLAKQAGADNYTRAKFDNEVLGESCDVGSKLVSDTDLRNAAVLPWHNDPHDFSAVARASRGKYLCKFLGVDWGGGGELEISFTTAAVVGLLPDGRLDIIYGRRLLLTHDPLGEAGELLRIYNAFECGMFCHDYNGAGSLHEAYMIQSGLPYEKVVPMVYYRSGAKDIMVLHRGTEEHHRSYYLLDKARSLRTTCEMIKLVRLRSFQYDFIDADRRGLLRDFTSLVEAKVETARAGEVYAIHRTAAFPDDFAHSVNFACCGIWHSQQNWPNLADIARLRLSPAQHEAMNPTNPWAGQ
jgi:hypothetical protein